MDGSPPHDCEYPSDFILVEGGVVLLKNEVEVSDPRYKLSTFARLSPNRHLVVDGSDRGSQGIAINLEWKKASV